MTKPAPLFSSDKLGQIILLKMCALNADIVLGSPANRFGLVPGKPAVLTTKPLIWSRWGWVMRYVSMRD